MISILRDFFTPEQRRTIGQEAKQALENRHWKEAVEAVETHLVDQAKHCDPDNKDKAQRVVIAMQIMEGIKRELIRKIEDGEMAQVELSEIEARKPHMRFYR